MAHVVQANTSRPFCQTADPQQGPRSDCSQGSRLGMAEGWGVLKTTDK